MEFLNPEIFAIALFFLSFFGLITSRNIIKSVVSIGLMEIAAIMFLLSFGFFNGIKPPIGENLESNVADPLPQALVITAIIIGITITAVNLTMLITLYRQYNTTDWSKVKVRAKGRGAK